MLKKITLISNNICFGPEPAIGTEVEQRLTINVRGQVWFSGYTYIRGFEHYSVGRKIRKTIPSDIAAKIANDIYLYCQEFEDVWVTDVGTYDLKLFFEDGTVEYASGSLMGLDDKQRLLCDFIRKVLGVDNLFLFDGNYGGNDE